MSTYSRLTDNQVKFIQREIEEQTWVNTQLRNYFEVNGLIKSIPEGMLKYETTIWDKMKPGQISADVHDLPDSIPTLTDQTTDIMYLGLKIVLGMSDVDRWKNNRLVGGGDMMPQVIAQQMKALYQQVDQFLAYGDDMKTPLGGDPMAAAGLFKGIFNGGTTLGAGAGADNDTTAAGDYVATVASYITALKNAGFEAEKYMIMSDLSTWEAAQQGANYYTTNGVTEKDRVLERGDIAGSMTSANFVPGSDNAEKRIIMTSPKTSEGKPAYRLLQGYNFKVIPLNGGFLNSNLQYEVAIIWSGVIEEIFATAIQASGALTVA